MEERSANLTLDPTGDKVIQSKYPTKCNITTDTVDPYEGNRSLHMAGLRRCFVMRPIGPGRYFEFIFETFFYPRYLSALTPFVQHVDHH